MKGSPEVVPGGGAGDRPLSLLKSRGTLPEALITAAFALFMTAPFLGRPFDLDDVIFLKLAAARLNEPLLLELQDFAFFGVLNETFIDTHPPLISAWLALMMKLGGASEIWLHFSFLGFPAIAAVSMYYLARRFCRAPVFAATILMATPGIAVMSHSVMSDLPGLAFWLAATALYVYGLERRSLGLMALSGIAITLGVFSSYMVLGAIPLLFFYALLKRELSWLAVLPLLLAISSFISFTVWHLAQTGSLPGLSHIYYVEHDPLAPGTILEKIVSLLAAVGGATIFPLILFRLALFKKRDSYIFLSLLILSFATAFFRYVTGESGLAETLLLSLLLPLGTLFLYMAIGEAWRRFRRGPAGMRAFAGMLLLWIAGVLFSVIFLLPYASVKYALPMFPPIVLLFMWLVEERAEGAGTKNLLTAALLSTAALGILVSFADYDLSASKRAFAQGDAVRIRREAEMAGDRVWFSAEFGDRYYLEQQGFAEITEETQLQNGDLVVLPLLVGTTIPTRFDEHLQLIERICVSGASPVRVIDHSSGAGLYGSRWGPLPYSVSNGGIEEYLVYRFNSS